MACETACASDALSSNWRLLTGSPDRTTLFDHMTRQFEPDTPWRLGVSNYQNTLVRPRVVGYKAHPVLLGEWVYVDIDRAK